MDALVSGGDEGGRRLPKAPVSCQSSFDPEISEWENPLYISRVSPSEFIGW